MQTHRRGQQGISDRHEALSRRSCDQCRARKIRCDRSIPCSNCSSANIECSHSRIISKGTSNTKKRILISEEYEQKINTIASDLEQIKSLLQSTQATVPSVPKASKVEDEYGDIHDQHTIANHPWMSAASSQLTNTAKIADVVRSVVHDLESGEIVVEGSSILPLLQNFLQVLDNPWNRRARTFAAKRRPSGQTRSSLPPFDATVSVLRWASSNDGDGVSMEWMSFLLPREMFHEACQHVYFAIDGYDDADFILTNGYLGRIFTEHAFQTKNMAYREHGELCRLNLQSAMVSLPLITSSSLKMVAALALCAFSAIESSQVSMAWDFISAAMNMSLTLAYHRNNEYTAAEAAMQETQRQLFWLIFRLERSLALRFNRSSRIHDSEITIPEHPLLLRHIRLGRLHGKIYEELYSPDALTETDAQRRSNAANRLAAELQQVIEEMQEELFHTASENLKERFRLLCELICQSSTLALILRAVLPYSGSSDRCIATARQTLDLHQQCMALVQNCGDDNSKVTLYANWNLVHVPFVPFILLFSNAIQFHDLADLARLEEFVISLRSGIDTSESLSHTFQLYEVLYQTARLRISKSSRSEQQSPETSKDLASSIPDLDFSRFEAGVQTTAQASPALLSMAAFDLGAWYYDNQYLTSLLDDSTIF